MLNSIYLSFQQVPQKVPDGLPTEADNTPIDFSNPFDVITFIVLPIVIVVFYIFWRRKRKRDQE